MSTIRVADRTFRHSNRFYSHQIDAADAAISKHLAVLSAAGLISQEKRGRVKWCKLEPDALREASAWMAGFGQFGPVELDALERFLEAELGPLD